MEPGGEEEEAAAPVPPVRAATLAPEVSPGESTLPERAAKPALPEREASAPPRRHPRRKKTETAFDGVSKSLSRNFRSLNRSLASIFK